MWKFRGSSGNRLATREDAASLGDIRISCCYLLPGTLSRGYLENWSRNPENRIFESFFIIFTYGVNILLFRCNPIFSNIELIEQTYFNYNPYVDHLPRKTILETLFYDSF